MVRLLGKYTTSLESTGRFRLPRQISPAFQDIAYIRLMVHRPNEEFVRDDIAEKLLDNEFPYLEIHPETGIEALMGLTGDDFNFPSETAGRQSARKFSESFVMVQVQSERITLPRRVRDHARLTADTALVFVGIDTYVELWSEEAYKDKGGI